jgi:adenine-specific DNA-methyltransferase
VEGLQLFLGRFRYHPAMAKKYDHLSREDLIALHQKRDASRKLGLVWERDEIEHEAALNDDFVALDLDESLSVGDGPHRNLIIEGDNFDALRYLNIAYRGRVKCIYIDPPYNTGNKDFVYNDHYVDKEDRFRHSTWIEFMYRRLVLAKDLLTSDGVIFVSIDDNELFNIGMLMNRVFGDSNFIANLIWKRKAGGGDDSDHIATEHEYIVCFALNKAKTSIARVLHESPSMTAKYNRSESGRRYYLERLDKTSLTYSKSMDFPIRCPDGTYISPHQPDPSNPRTSWRWGKKTVEERAEELTFVKDKKTKEWHVYTRTWEPLEGVTPRSLLVEKHHGRNRDGTQELTDLIGPRVFNNPKPTALIGHIINIGAYEADAIVLDFFAGSGTTAHAVLDLNKKDGGQRRFILVSCTEATPDLPSKNICRDVCAKRVRRVIEGHSDSKGNPVVGLGGEFAYLRATRLPMERLHSTIRHDQVWTALQQLHAGVITPYSKSDLHVLDITDTDLYYVSKMSKAVLDTLSVRARKKKPAVVFSWQPGLLTQRIASEHIAFEKIPEFLVDRFGGQQ